MLTIKKQFIHLMNHTLLALLTAPLTLLLFGAWRGMTFNGPNYLLLFMLYLFLMFTHALERLLSKREQSDAKLPYKMILVLGILSIGMLTIIFYLSNLILTAILLLYLIYLILQFYPYSMTNTFYEILLRPFFKILILSSVSFFSQANFIPLQLQYEVLPLILFHIFGLIQVQIKNTAGSNQPLTYYQQLLLKHSKFLKMTIFLLSYATGILQILNLNSSLWAISVFVLSILLVFPLFKRKFQSDLRIEQYLTNYGFLFTLSYSFLFLV
ncbi:hypothetical protein [Trichococcus pasteurii]|uniref:Prenyltransferase n=1 Tax=Trichococcus pasteurii TaxID=43064 RepID=A0A1W1IBH5_9LACT|nr:hypothetical protein [Trichococcus pasteurii]SFE21844.1 hypothetical protein SAMN04488086_1028 [Trichococcus pasteurii]SLM50335.1 Hypothetical protein TPAS_5 [Trichococcus pasteurii]SSB91216.1 Hypothetical protein TPAS_5 [Trichococcus pasteurii]